jgi:hypothetical protein
MERMILVVTSKWHRWKGGWERKMTVQYATFEGYPALYDDVETYEAYVLFRRDLDGDADYRVQPRRYGDIQEHVPAHIPAAAAAARGSVQAALTHDPWREERILVGVYRQVLSRRVAI